MATQAVRNLYMLRLSLSVLVCAHCLLPRTSQAEATKANCYDEAHTQVELNSCAGEEYAVADAELNRVYQGVLARYKDDSKFIAKFRASQRAWLTYRDAEFEAKFPHADESKSTHFYGSIFPMCAAQYRAQLTRERIARLREWLDGTEEGDSCAGSVNSKSEP
jgi:uncharacterized protein YecT (DUF1311 family)